MTIGDTGISTSYKVPRYIAKIVLAAGAVSSGAQRLRCLLVGMKTTGDMVADGTPIRVTSSDEVDLRAGAGSQLAMMAYAALTIPSLELYIAAVTEPSGGTKATITIVIAGTWTTGGVLRFRLAGKPVTFTVAPTATVDDVGTGLTAAFNGKPRLPAAATYSSGSDTVTLEIKNKGAGGKDWILYHDPLDKPSGLTLTITGSATVNTEGYRFGASSTGTGAEDVATLLTKLTKTRYARIALGHNDTTNAALWESHVDSKAGPLSLLLDQLVFAHNGTKAQAKTLGQTTLNAFRAQVIWFRNSENHPAEIAALIAARRSVWEQAHPVPDYDGDPYTYLAPQAFEDDQPTDAEQDEVLNAGVTPMTTTDGTARVVRSITSYCLANGVQDERCLDIGDIVMTDYATLDMKLMYENDFRPANPVVQDNPAPGEPEPPSGVAFPALWNGKVTGRLIEYKRNGWTVFEPKGSWAPTSVFNKAGGFIASDIPLSVSRVQHRLDAVMRQVATVG